MKLFLKYEVQELAFRKLGMLAGGESEAEVLAKGEEIWKKEFGHDEDEEDKKPKPEPVRKEEKAAVPAPTKEKSLKAPTSKQQ